jgi:hypothetical protein
LDKTRNNKILLRSCLCGFILTVLLSVNLLVVTPPGFTKSPLIVFATSNNEDNQDENVDNEQPEDSNTEQQEQGTGSDDEGSGVASEQENACPAVAFEGPSYIDGNGCSAPCPAISTDSQGDSIPQECPQPTKLTSDDTAGTTQQQQEQEAPGEQDVAPPQIQQGLTGENTQFEAQPSPGIDPSKSTEPTLEFGFRLKEFEEKPPLGLPVVKPEQICDDRIDNDFDGLIDNDDADCQWIATEGQLGRDQDPQTPTDTTKYKETDCAFSGDCCNNNIDDERDGFKDMKDKDCNGQYNKGKEVCDDGADNDEDGYIDYDDGECIPPFTGPTESPESPDPSKGDDIGFPTRAPEAPPLFEVQPEGIDLGELTTKGQFQVQEKPPADLDDAKSSLATEEGLCNDGIDNDKDKLTDTEDRNDCPPPFEAQPPPGFDPFAP